MRQVSLACDMREEVRYIAKYVNLIFLVFLRADITEQRDTGHIESPSAASECAGPSQVILGPIPPKE